MPMTIIMRKNRSKCKRILGEDPFRIKYVFDERDRNWVQLLMKE